MQILINIGRISRFLIIFVFFTTFPFGSVFELFFDDFFDITFCYAISL